jgi:hypothetical protein
MRRPLTLAALALLLALAALARAAPPPEPLLWKLGREEGLVYKLSGPDAKALSDAGVEERTLFGPEIAADGRGYLPPVGRPQDLIWRHLFGLPSGAVEPGARFPIEETHTLPPYTIGPIHAKGETRVLGRKGALVQLETRLQLSRGPNAPQEGRFLAGTLLVSALFHAKKGQLASGEVALEWTENEGAPPNQKQKSLALKGALELSRALALDPAKGRSRAEQAVRRALDREVKPFLERALHRQKAAEHQLGWLGAMLYAGAKGGLDTGSGAAERGYEEIEKLPWRNVYSVSLALLALEARSVKRVRARAGETRVRYEKEAVSARDRALMEKLARWLVEARLGARGIWGYESPAQGASAEKIGNGDLSVTQFAVLALHAAARSGVPVPADLWREVARMLTSGQQEESGPSVVPALLFEEGAPLAKALGLPEAGDPSSGGGTAPRERAGEGRGHPARGFFYAPPGFWRTPYHSMTAAGVSSALIARQWLPAAPDGADAALLSKLDAAIRDGLCWMQHRHQMRWNAPDNPWQPYYYLYSVEKAYEIARVEKVAGHDWWAEGVEELLIREKPGGGWGGESYETAFAVLFLTRASAEPEFEVKEAGRESSGGKVSPEDADAVVVEGVGLVSAKEVLRASEVQDAAKRKERLGIAERAIAGLDLERRPILAPALGKLLGSPYADVKRFSEKALREIAGEKVPDEKAALSFHARWEETERFGLSGDPDRIPELRGRLGKDALPALRRTAALALSRLRAIEAIPDLADEMARPGDREHRAYIRRVLVGTLGKDAGDDPAAWRALYEESGKALLASEETRRDVRRLALPGSRAAARERLLAKGRGAVRALIDALPAGGGTSPALPSEEEARALAQRAEAASLLREITGEDHGDERARWDAWWRGQEEKDR